MEYLEFWVCEMGRVIGWQIRQRVPESDTCRLMSFARLFPAVFNEILGTHPAPLLDLIFQTTPWTRRKKNYAKNVPYERRTFCTFRSVVPKSKCRKSFMISNSHQIYITGQRRVYVPDPSTRHCRSYSPDVTIAHPATKQRVRQMLRRKIQLTRKQSQSVTCAE